MVRVQATRTMPSFTSKHLPLSTDFAVVPGRLWRILRNCVLNIPPQGSNYNACPFGIKTHGTP